MGEFSTDEFGSLEKPSKALRLSFIFAFRNHGTYLHTCMFICNVLLLFSAYLSLAREGMFWNILGNSMVYETENKF